MRTRLKQLRALLNVSDPTLYQFLSKLDIVTALALNSDCMKTSVTIVFSLS